MATVVPGRDLRLHREVAIEVLRADLAPVVKRTEEAHAKEIIHRDINPENVLLHEGEAVRDFAIALAVAEADLQPAHRDGPSLGTPQYISPQAGNR